MEKLWSLYNKDEKLRIDDLRADQVRTILLSIPQDKTVHWYGCREGDPQWEKLTEIPDFYDHMSKSSLVESRRPLFEEPADATAPTLQIESVQVKERRSARRYTRNLIFSAQAGEFIFRCETADISMAGVSLKQDLPSGLASTFRAELTLSGEKVNILCSRITATQLKIVDADGWTLLRQWIVNW